MIEIYTPCQYICSAITYFSIYFYQLYKIHIGIGHLQANTLIHGTLPYNLMSASSFEAFKYNLESDLFKRSSQHWIYNLVIYKHYFVVVSNSPIGLRGKQPLSFICDIWNYAVKSFHTHGCRKLAWMKICKNMVFGSNVCVIKCQKWSGFALYDLCH